MPVIIRACALRWFVLPDSFYSRAPIGRCFRSLPATRLEAVRRFTAFYWARSGQAPSEPHSRCHGSRAFSGPTAWVAVGTLGTAVAMMLFAFARQPMTALAASLIAGMSWIVVLATINVSAQVALPGWVRGRGLSIYGTVMFGALTLGSAVWGEVAALADIPEALVIAAAGALTAIPLLWRWKLNIGADLDLAPSLHWPAPILSAEVDADRGPVLVTVEYQIKPADRGPFLDAIAVLAAERRRDGAFDWDVFEDLSQQGHFVETFMLDSWIEHLRQHERVTHADRELQDRVNRYQVDGAPKVTHLIAALGRVGEADRCDQLR